MEAPFVLAVFAFGCIKCINCRVLTFYLFSVISWANKWLAAQSHRLKRDFGNKSYWKIISNIQKFGWSWISKNISFFSYDFNVESYVTPAIITINLIKLNVIWEICRISTKMLQNGNFWRFSAVLYTFTSLHVNFNTFPATPQAIKNRGNVFAINFTFYITNNQKLYIYLNVCLFVLLNITQYDFCWILCTNCSIEYSCTVSIESAKQT